MNPLYPKGPTKVPPELTKPTARFKLHAWLAGAYLGIGAGWFEKDYDEFLLYVVIVCHC